MTIVWVLYDTSDHADISPIDEFDSHRAAYQRLCELCEDRARRCIADSDDPGATSKPARELIANRMMLEYDIVKEERE